MLPDFADIERREEAITTARLLLETGAVKYDLGAPFHFGSGLESPVHVDARHILGYPAARRRLMETALQAVLRDIGVGALDAIACRTEGQGVPFATLLADHLDLPLLFVRRDACSDPHKHGVEGRIEQGWRVLLVEQLATDAARKECLIAALRGAGARVDHLFVLFQYGVFEEIHTHLCPLGVKMHALANWWDLLDVAADGGSLPPAALSAIRGFLDDPAHWHCDRARKHA